MACPGSLVDPFPYHRVLATVATSFLVWRLCDSRRRCTATAKFGVLILLCPAPLALIVPSGGQHASVHQRGACGGLRFSEQELDPRPTWGIVALFQNEALGIVEWLESHRLEGATEFILIDDASNDAGPIKATRWGRAHPAVSVTVLKRRPGWSQERSTNEGRTSSTSSCDDRTTLS